VTPGNKLSDTHILLVEDEPSSRHMVITVLEREGATVSVAENAEEAMKLMAAAEFEAVVTDIKLPKMDGIGLLGNIRKIKSELPVIMITGYGSIGSAVEALKLGAQDYLIKPLGDGTQLKNSVWKAVEHYRLTLKNIALQAELKQSEETFRMLFHNASDAIFLNGISQGGVPSCFIEVNDAAKAMLGYSTREFFTSTLLDITAPEYRKETARILKAIPEHQHKTFETVHVKKNGDRIPVEISAHLFKLKSERAILSIARNIAERREMERHITEATEKESRRIGQELHDVLCQDLASIKMLSSVLKTTLDSESSKGIRDAVLIRDLTSSVLSSTRLLCAGLFPAELEAGGLPSALEHLAITHEQIFHISCTFSNSCGAAVEDKSIALHLYRIAQQAVSNAATHSKAKNISIILAERAPGVVLTVEDDGTGISEGNGHKSNGMGLHIMKYRAKIIGAVLAISKRENGGTKVECTWQ